MKRKRRILFGWLVIIVAAPDVAVAENCRALPFGPERRSCAMREHPEIFQAKLDRCRQLAAERGNTYRTGTGAGGMKEFVQGCMKGTQR